MSVNTLKALFCSLCLILPASLQAKGLGAEHWTTKQGLAVYFLPLQTLPIVDIKLAFAAGSARDGEHQGVAALTNGLLDQGSAKASADDIAERFVDAGAAFSASSARDSAIVSLRSLSDDKLLPQALSNFLDVIAAPSFPSKALERGKRQQLAAIAARQQSPSAVANQAFYKALYGGHPYGQPVLGDAASVNALDQKAVKDFYQQYYTAQNATLVIVGDIKQGEAKRIAEQIASQLPQGKKAAKIASEISNKAENQNVNYPAKQTNVRIGQLGIDWQDKERYALTVGNYSLGGGALISRLNQEVREQRGLSYAIYSQFIPMQAKGPFIVSFSTRSSKAGEALAITKKVIAGYLQQGPTEAEVSAAKAYITGNFPLRLDSNANIADMLLVMGFYQLPLNYIDDYVSNIERVNLADVRQALQQHIKLDQLITITVGQNG